MKKYFLSLLLIITQAVSLQSLSYEEMKDTFEEYRFLAGYAALEFAKSTRDMFQKSKVSLVGSKKIITVALLAVCSGLALQATK